ncbi:hypothetical protein [Lentzea cavernae]|uniref:Uncharacterized protein n=1 Tax=Lentzea cavernae TaxID=2020703 RepID=A0ABQ3MQH9_9PSEU|nr:hypothetical protein [Lentzea cavernae]GHH57822.1 hypothetical protein GCM10017774_78170 [Lentzea cavernae]
MNRYATWNNGLMVAIPDTALTELELAWRQAEPWHEVQFVPEGVASQVADLDTLARHVSEIAVLQVARQQRTILTHSGVKWSLQAVQPRSVPERDARADTCSWEPGTPLPQGGAWWIACRVFGLSIPLLPAKAVTSSREETETKETR